MASPTSRSINGTEGSPTPEFPIAPLVLGLVLSIFSIFLNGFLFTVMTKERKVFFRTRVSYFVVNLALADFLTGVSHVYLVFQVIIDIQKLLPVQPFVMALHWTTVQCSFFSLFVMSVDRLVIVQYPLSWSMILTIKRTIASIAIVWVVSIIGGIMTYLFKMKALFAILVFVEFCTMVFLVNSCCIYPVLRKREQGQFISGAPSQQSRSSQHDKMSTVVIILMAVLIITQLPFVICLKMLLADKIIDDSILQNVNMETYRQAYLYAQNFASLNFVVNPIIYAWRLRTYRKAFLTMLKCGNSS